MRAIRPGKELPWMMVAEFDDGNEPEIEFFETEGQALGAAQGHEEDATSVYVARIFHQKG